MLKTCIMTSHVRYNEQGSVICDCLVYACDRTSARNVNIHYKPKWSIIYLDKHKHHTDVGGDFRHVRQRGE